MSASKPQLTNSFKQKVLGFLKTDGLVVAFLLLTAALLRFLDITSIPCGLFPDQASHGLDAVLLAHGLVLPVYGGDEGMFVYFVAIVQFFFGTGIWQVIATSAALGTATILTTYLAVKEILGRQIAFLTAFLLAVSSWHIALSRDGFRAILVPLLVTLFLYALGRAWHAATDKQHYIRYAIAAALFALGFYTYYAYVLFALAMGVMAVVFALTNRKKLAQFLRDNKQPLLLALLVFLVVLAPIAIYILLYPTEYFSRVGQVSIFAQAHTLGDRAAVVYQNAKATIGGIFTTGDLNWRHNASGHPFLALTLLPFFVVAVGYVLYKRGIYLAILFLIAVMCLPAIMTNDGLPPHGLRLIGIIPFLFLLAAIPLSWLLSLGSKVGKLAGTAIVSLVLIFVAWQGYQNYFGEAPYQAHYYYDYRCDLTALTGYLKTNVPIKVITDDFSLDTIKYLMLPETVVHQTPEQLPSELTPDFVSKNQQLLLASAFGKFDQALLDKLTQYYSVQAFNNKFDRTDFYLLSKK